MWVLPLQALDGIGLLICHVYFFCGCSFAFKKWIYHCFSFVSCSEKFTWNLLKKCIMKKWRYIWASYMKNAKVLFNSHNQFTGSLLLKKKKKSAAEWDTYHIKYFLAFMVLALRACPTTLLLKTQNMQAVSTDWLDESQGPSHNCP